MDGKILTTGLAAAACACCCARQKQLENEACAANRAIWCPPEKAKGTIRLPLAEQLAKIVECCHELQRPSYRPTPWAAGSYANVGLHMFKDQIGHWLALGPPLLHEQLTMPDGGSISIDYCDDAPTRLLPADAPVVIVLHTITGSGPTMRWFLRQASSRGWRGCVLNRRAAYEALTTPQFNVMGSIEDTRTQVEAVQKRYPQAFLALVGISAGSGLLVSYLGDSGANTPICAACCLCPAYDVSQAFKGLRERHPLAERFLLKATKERFISKNAEILKRHDPVAVERCLNAGTIHELLHEQIPFTGSPTPEQYFKRNNPMEHREGVSVPMLILNADDDMVCLPENIREDVCSDNGGGILIRTARGSHCAYCEGWSGGGSYLCRLSLDFLAAAKEVGTHAVDVSRPQQVT